MSSATEQEGMLEFEKQIFLDILQEDGLVVAAKGLGLDNVIVNLLKVYCDPGNLVFVLGTEGKHQEWLVSTLIKNGANPTPKVVTSEIGVVEREQTYLEGGVWFVPTRILVVDLIKKRIPIDLITGFVVCKAHNILKNHQDSFVLRLYRQGNKNGFVKAFSNEASTFKSGFSKAEQVLKALFVRNLFLWPRYHAAVKSSLNQCKPVVVELHLEMSSTMLQLQNALLDLIKMSVQELKRLNPTLDTEEVTVENAISDSFHKILHSQLDPVWHALSERTKSLLADLKLFHYMIVSLLTLDSVSFYSLVNSQRKSDCALRGSGWHLLPTAEILFTVAKQRVFGSSHVINVNDIDPEPNPKWLVLSEVLGEIHRNFHKKDVKKADIKKEEDIEEQLKDIFEEKDEESKPAENNDIVSSDQCDILILNKEERTCSQLQMYLTLGSKELLCNQYRKCFSNKKDLNNRNDQNNEESSSKKEEGPEEELALSEENDDDQNLDTYMLSLSRIALTQLESNSKVNLAGHFEDTLSQTQNNKTVPDPEHVDVETDQENPTAAPVIVIKSYKKNLMYLPQALEEMKPNYVIIYDSDMTLVRQLEVYQRNNPQITVRVYFLVYGGTVEEQAYLTSLRKEKEAFDHLIEEKARIVIPEDRSDCPELMRDATKANETAIRTRKGGLESPKKINSKIIVDMREFRSELPALIHSRGIDIEPLTITIGDYILSPDICLERKSIPDLIQSLNSGRLYNQALAMTRHYAKPMLLIEFDKDKPFDLQDRYYLSTDASSDQLVTKLQLLTLHFPQLRLVWSPSPHATAQLFEELKEGRPEPDVAKASGLGLEETALDEDRFNPGVQNFLSKLPGITNKNIYTLLHKGKSLDHLNSMSKDEISDMLQNTVEGEIIYNAFHKRFEPDGSNYTGASNRGRLRSGALRGKRKRFH